MKKFFFHIGSHKTASTSIQKFCFKYSEKLNDLGLLYPNIWIPENSYGHHHLAWLSNGNKKYDESFGKLSDLHKILDTNSNILISSEEFSILNDPNLLLPLINIIKKANYEIKIIWILRKQEELFNSLLQEIIKKRILLNDIDQLFFSLLKNKHLLSRDNIYCFDYKILYEKILDFFQINKNDIYINWFPKKNSILNFFNLFFSESMDEKMCKYISQHDSLLFNESMSQTSFDMLNYFNTITENYIFENNLYSNIKDNLIKLGEFDSKQVNLLDDKKKEKMIKSFEESNRFISKIINS